MSLSDLPDEILGLISSCLNGFDNCHLWIASDSKLKQRLISNIITQFEIVYTIPGRYLWPGNFLKKLKRLSRLSLIADEQVRHLPIQNVELFPIETLKYLNLDAKSCDHFLGQKSAQTREKHSIPSNNSTGPKTSPKNKLTNLNDLYCNLESLKVTNAWSESEYSIDFLRSLPQNLKSFLLPYTDFKLDTADPTKHLNMCIEVLPRTLTELQIGFGFHYTRTPCLDLSKLPPNLTSLTTNVPININNSSFMILRTFRSLHIDGEVYNFEKFSSLVPAGLESLSISADVNPHLFAKLHNLQNLRHLELSVRYILESKDPIQLDQTKFPPNLTSLICRNLSFPCSPNGLFGKKITTIHLDFVSGVDREFISTFPESLTDLTISSSKMQSFDQSFGFFALLPRNLKSLKTSLNIIENTSLLPESLTHLQLTTGTMFDISHFDKLPSKLESFIFIGQLPESILKQLPTTLKHLDISSDVVVDDEVVRLLPRGLKELHLKTPDTITDASAPHFPPNLEQLYLHTNTNMTDDAIESLPRSLIHLSLAGLDFTDKSIKNLPRNLLVLRFGQTRNVTSKASKDIPEYLKVLFLPKCDDWSVDNLNDLPPFLSVLFLGNRDFRFAWNQRLRSDD